MITDRPLKEVPTRALYALHKGIERQSGLTTGAYRDEIGVCAIGSLGNMACKHQIGFDMSVASAVASLELNDIKKTSGNPNGISPAYYVYALNDDFDGSPEERREFMLRHIVEELRQHDKSVPKEHEKSTKILTNASL